MYSSHLSCNSDKSLWLKSWKKKFKVPHWKSRSSEIGCIKQVFEQNHQDPNFSYVERFAQNLLNDQSSEISLKFYKCEPKREKYHQLNNWWYSSLFDLTDGISLSSAHVYKAERGGRNLRCGTVKKAKRLQRTQLAWS